MIKGRGYAWGLSSVILAAGFFVLPIFLIKHSSSETLEIILSCIRFLWICFPGAAFIFAFIGKVRSEWGTKARSLCNIGAGIGWVVSVVLMYFGLGSFWMDAYSLPAVVTEAAAFVYTVLISGYFLIAYIRGKILWFI